MARTAAARERDVALVVAEETIGPVRWLSAAGESAVADGSVAEDAAPEVREGVDRAVAEGGVAREKLGRLTRQSCRIRLFRQPRLPGSRRRWRHSSS